MGTAAVHTVRIEGVILPMNAHIVVGLRAIYGVGGTRAQQICEAAQVEKTKKAKELTEPEIRALQECVAQYEVEGVLRRKRAGQIKRLKDIRSYRGMRHARRLPCRGQRTRTNASTAKGTAGKSTKAK